MPQIEGIVDDILFRNESNGFTVMSIKSGRERISAVGVVSAISSGEHVAIAGDWVDHPEYGKQIRITSIESVRPTTASGIQRYLGSGIVKGVGPSTAKLIVEYFGKHTLDVLDNEPHRITEIDGIGPKRAQMILESYTEQREMRQTMIFLQTYGISPALSMKIYRIFGDRAQTVLRNDPYLLVDHVEGIGFKTADGIAFQLGIEKESEHRLECGIKYILSEAVSTGGHCFMPREMLLDFAERTLEVEYLLVERALSQLVIRHELVLMEIEGELVVYTPLLFEAEGEVARRMIELVKSVDASDDADAEAAIKRYEAENGVSLSVEQRKAVRAAVFGGVTIITGGPGTGKTTSINCIIRLLKREGEIAMCAPTGRAAKRMTETTGQDAKTIHRLLEYGGDDDSFQKNQDDPLDAKTVIVDEMSMVDIFLMRALLRALKPGTRLIMVGDADQLPSVGAGNVLFDLIKSGVMPVVQLTSIFRQAQESMIVMNAHRINHGEPPILNRKDSDFFMERLDTPDQVQSSVIALVKTRLPDFMGFDKLRGIQVMTPMKKSDVGVWQLNRVLQDALNPEDIGKPELSMGVGRFRLGDKVMQTRNNYQLEWRRGREEGQGVFNGDIGFITKIDVEERQVTICFDDERVCEYDAAGLEDLELAYCMSVHKSQGSEFDAVVLPLLSGPPRLFTRNLLYTAVTRARRLVVIVGRESCVRQMISNDHIAKRYSALAMRIGDMKMLMAP